jgi:hypothetical protein
MRDRTAAGDYIGSLLADEAASRTRLARCDESPQFLFDQLIHQLGIRLTF